jgi:hypothetical protein
MTIEFKPQGTQKKAQGTQLQMFQDSGFTFQVVNAKGRTQNHRMTTE